MTKNQVLDYIQNKYNILPNYPWHDDNAVFRHPDNRKWFGLLMEIGRDKFVVGANGKIDVLNIKGDPTLISFLRTQKGFYPAYHMNKEKWLSICLDGSAPDEEIKSLIDSSFEMTKINEKQSKNKVKKGNSYKS
ncbi:MAG: MmcQ/YjbR family DNA-binding protein [Lachnospiraceae bacterium]|jgi:predicted DNA-binding protein (MmcQ/YjbR family)|nr:MmcQ/YjbR family DNA-binding protein [Lachnospiraceae bacterium]